MYLFGISIPLLCLFWHCICSILTIVDHVVWVRLQPEGATTDITHKVQLAFLIIGMLAYALCGAPLFVYAYKYGFSHSERRKRFMCGMVTVFLSWSLPVFIIKLTIFCINIDRRNPIEGVVFALSTISTAFGGCVVWFSYMRLVAECVHRYHGIERWINPGVNLSPYPMQPVHASPNAFRPDTI